MNHETQQAHGLPAGWVWTTLGDVTDTTRRRVQPQDYPSLRFVGMEHVEAHTMRILSTVPASEMRSTAEYFEPGDVLYGRLRPYLNKVFCADFAGLVALQKIVELFSRAVEAQEFFNGPDVVG
jgi:type I restriction enzyme, S subunit